MSGGGEKRKGGGGGGGGKRSKRHYGVGGGSDRGGLTLGTRGILISCVQGKENIAGREACDVLNQAYEALNPSAEPAPEAAATDKPTDIEAALASEVAELKDTANKLFYWHSAGAGSLIYVEYRGGAGAPSPTDLVLHICQAAADTLTAKTRFCNRFYPVEYTCAAELEAIGKLAGAKVVPDHFPPDAEPIHYAVQFEHRNAPKLDRMKLIDAFTQHIKMPPHKVNLDAPVKTILVNLLKNVCAVSVVPKYRELKKFNLHTITNPPEEEEEGKAEPAKAAKGEGKEAGAGEKEPAGGEAAAQPAEEGGGGGAAATEATAGQDA